MRPSTTRVDHAVEARVTVVERRVRWWRRITLADRRHNHSAWTSFLQPTYRIVVRAIRVRESALSIPNVSSSCARGLLAQNGELTVVCQASLENEVARLVDWSCKVSGISAGLS